MATEEGKPDSQSPTSPLPPQKTTKGIILGPDGKPCRTCNSYASFSSASKSAITIKPSSKGTVIEKGRPLDCPPDVNELGRASWTLLHSITATYPPTPTPLLKTQTSQFLSLFATLYPCWSCAADFQAYIEKNQVRTESREAFGRWMCEAHNEVNRKLGKREFDCGGWERRWGDKAYDSEEGGC